MRGLGLLCGGHERSEGPLGDRTHGEGLPRELGGHRRRIFFTENPDDLRDLVLRLMHQPPRAAARTLGWSRARLAAGLVRCTEQLTVTMGKPKPSWTIEPLPAGGKRRTVPG